MAHAKPTDESRRKALDLLDELHRQFGTPSDEDLRELQEILGDSPDPEELPGTPEGERLRSRSASTPTR